MPQKIKNYYHLLQSLFFNIVYGFPARKLIIIGVTGTDGKTTSVNMIYHILNQNGKKVAMISTINAKLGNKEIDTGLHVTTPEPWDVPKILRNFVKEGVEYVVLESTSSGLDQNRLFGVSYDSSTITNIGVDHIDYHKTWENYANAKFKIIKKTVKNGRAVLNKDHKSADWLGKELTKQKKLPEVVWYSTSEVENFDHSTNGIHFQYKNKEFKIPVIGEYNLSNALGVINVTEKYLGLEKIGKALETFQAPKGRMQLMSNDPTVIIDFAHTPSSLERALESVNKIRKEGSKIITIFGCAGQRDPERRKMGAVAAQLSDIIVITLEDPRTEDIREINSQIIKYAEESKVKLIKRFRDHDDFMTFPKDEIRRDYNSPVIYSFDYAEVQNRKDALEFAIKNLAEKEDIVFITGKGHEESLAIGSPVVEYPYSDQETVAEVLNLD